MFVVPDLEGLSWGGSVFLQYVAVGGVLDVLRCGDRGNDDRCVCGVDLGWETEERAGVGCDGFIGADCCHGAGVCDGFDCEETFCEI